MWLPPFAHASPPHAYPASLWPPNPQALVSAFTFYAAQGGGGDPYHMSLNAFTSFLDDAAIPDADSA